MSDIREDVKRPPERSLSPASKKLRERVDFFEKVWTGHESGAVHDAPDAVVDVEELEKKLENEKRVEHNRLERVKLRHTPTGSPQHVLYVNPGEEEESFQETVTRTVEEGDLASGIIRSVKTEKITVKKTIKQVTSSSSTTTLHTLSPLEDRLLEDSAYQTHSNGNLSATHSNSSSVSSSLTGRFPSEENLLRTPSREMLRDDCCDSSGSSKVTTSSSEWYNEYMSQSFHNTSKLEQMRRKSQYDDRIAVIRGQQQCYAFNTCLLSIFSCTYRALFTAN